MMKYFKIKSVTWWSGVCLMGYGVFSKDYSKVIEGAALVGLRGVFK